MQRRSPRNHEEVPIPQTFDMSSKAIVIPADVQPNLETSQESGISNLGHKISSGIESLKDAIFGKKPEAQDESSNNPPLKHAHNKGEMHMNEAKGGSDVKL